jgi:hypothetical protein
MAFRTPNTVSTGEGTYNIKEKTFSGSGKAPAGYKKVPEPTVETTPIVTTNTKNGTTTVSTSGFPSQVSAKRATRRARTANRKAQRIRRAVTQTRQNASERKRKSAQTDRRLARTEAAIKSRRPKPTSIPKTFKGKPTAGTPTLKSLQVAAKTGALKTNQKGFVTTPPVRKATRELKQAKKAVRKTTGLTGPLTQGQKTFARRVAKKTPLSPRVVAAQTLAEQSGEAAQQREAEGNHNWLNIGYFDSGPGELTRDATWSNPKAAADATVRFLKGQEFGPSEGIKAILPASKGRSDREQIAAIANSGWASNPGYQELIEGTHDLIGVKQNPKAVKRLQRAKADAKSLGLNTSKVGEPAKKVVTRFKAAMVAAKELEKAKLPYVWGGGHGDLASRPTGGGLDCSGAVSYVLNKIGALKGSLVSGDMGSALSPGPGAITVFYNPVHTFMRIGNRYFGTSTTNPGGGAGFIEGTPDDLSKYSVGHVPGLGKQQALQLGITDLSGSTSFPGLSLSGSGTTATIESGASTTKGKPGFSQKPITPAQKARRKFKRLDELGVGSSEPPSDEVSPTLKRLEEKYGVAA